MSAVLEKEAFQENPIIKDQRKIVDAKDKRRASWRVFVLFITV